MTDPHQGRALATLLATLLLAVGIASAGFFVGRGLLLARTADRTVTVRGLAEEDVVADLATWTLAYSAQGTDLAAVQGEMGRDTASLRAFLRQHGFKKEDMRVAGVSVGQWFDPQRGSDTITIRQRLQLRTSDVQRAQQAFAQQFELVRQGVVLEDGSEMIYSFTHLNSLKPKMIANATKEARRGAEQFAKDSGSQVGAIRRATQGYFSISARDGDQGGQSSPLQKVRVVTTIDFDLR